MGVCWGHRPRADRRFVAKDRHCAIGDGPIVVRMDGSDNSFGALVTGIDIARRLGVELHVVAACDPYYHYVAFNRISTVLDEEAGRVFRFKEQEELHEELIDDGIARIYQSHLNVAEQLATEAGARVTCEFLAGKPWQAIRKYLEKSGASLPVIGQAEHVPPADPVADETTMWSEEAEMMIERAPEFVRNMARMGVIRMAQREGHTFITACFVEQVMGQMMPGKTGTGDAASVAPDRFDPLPWDRTTEAALVGVKNIPAFPPKNTSRS